MESIFSFLRKFKIVFDVVIYFNKKFEFVKVKFVVDLNICEFSSDLNFMIFKCFIDVLFDCWINN